MSKNHRGSGIRSLPKHGRGTCAICGKTNIKVLWEKEVNGQTVNICKYCNANLKNKAKNEPAPAPAAEAPAEAPVEAAATEAPAAEAPATEEAPAAEAPAEEAPATEA
jgi:ribosome-binding protein aMBF1 (putative translation factor)